MNSNLAEVMTKLTIIPECVQAVDEGKLHYEVKQSFHITINTVQEEKKTAECGNHAIYTTK